MKPDITMGTNTRLKKSLSLLSALAAAALLMIMLARPAAADDDDPPGRVARLNYLHGAVSFQPAGEDEWVAAGRNRPITTGDKLWIDKDARAELHIGSASIRLGETTGFSFLNLNDRTVQIRLTGGTVAIRVRRLDESETFEVDTPNLAFSILRPGTYRISTNDDGNSTVVSVRGGQGEVTGRERAFTLHAGQTAIFNGTDMLESTIERMRSDDEFDEWCRNRDRREDRAESSRYVSRDVIGYEDLDEYGIWRQTPGYGPVWVPTAVVTGWSPYHYGHWAWVSPWGWTWVDDAPWGFAPFHYGRWVFVGGYWGWVPGPIAVRPVYAPALVAFVGGRHFSLAIGFGGGVGVGWFPLGPREVYVPSYRVSPAYVQNVNTSNTTVNNTYVTNVYNNQTNIRNTNIENTDARVSNIKYVNQNVPGAVTAVPQSAFASAQSVSTAAVHVDAKQVATAQVNTTAAVAPVRESVLGGTVSGSVNNSVVAKPPAAAVERAVVAKTAPPPPPISFEKQQHALATHPGRPLGRNEVEELRPTTNNAPAVHSIARGVITIEAAKPTTNDAASHSNSAKSDQHLNSTPASTANSQSGNAKYNPKLSTPPGTKREGEHDERTGSAHENVQPSTVGQPGAIHAVEPNNSRPNAASSGSENEREDRNAAGRSVNKPQIRDDRPASANTERAINQPPSSPDAEKDGSRHSNNSNLEHADKPAAMRDDRPPSARGNHPATSPNEPVVTQPGNSRPTDGGSNESDNGARTNGTGSPAAGGRVVRDDRPPAANVGNKSNSNAEGVRHSIDANIEHANKPAADRNDRPASTNSGAPINSTPFNPDVTKPSNTRNSNVAPGYSTDSSRVDQPKTVRDDRPPSGSSGHPASANDATRKPANVSNGNVNNNPPPAATHTIYNPPPSAPRPDAQVNRAPKQQAERHNGEEKKEEKKPEKSHQD